MYVTSRSVTDVTREYITIRYFNSHYCFYKNITRCRLGIEATEMDFKALTI